MAALKGIDAILAGSVAELGSRIRINARLMSFPGGNLITAASAYMGMDGIDQDLLLPIDEDSRRPVQDGEAGAFAKLDLKGVSYELLQCRETPRQIVCELVLTNNLADREMHFRGYRTFLFDQRGYQFFATTLKVADVESGKDLHKRLISELPMPLAITFAGVPSAIDFIKVLHLWTGDGELEFRDIPLNPE